MKQKKISYKGEKLNYIITSEGTVFSCYSNKYLKLTKLNTGYIDVVLKVCGEKKHFSVHRLVAEAFLENPKNYNSIDKDGSRIDYASLTEASLAEGVTLSAISFSLKSDGKQKSCGKYWFYK